MTSPLDGRRPTIPATAHRISLGRKKKMTPSVLLTDADTILLAIYRAFLIDQKFKVRTASTALECVDLLRRWQPDVLVLDADLPWGSGKGVLALMLEEDVPAVPVLLLTSDPMSAEEVFPELDHTVLIKPVPALVLVNAIRTLVQAEHLGPPR
jgi:DNA-binding response OmpR family regulator